MVSIKRLVSIKAKFGLGANQITQKKMKEKRVKSKWINTSTAGLRLIQQNFLIETKITVDFLNSSRFRNRFDLLAVVGVFLKKETEDRNKKRKPLTFLFLSFVFLCTSHFRAIKYFNRMHFYSQFTQRQNEIIWFLAGYRGKVVQHAISATSKWCPLAPIAFSNRLSLSFCPSLPLVFLPIISSNSRKELRMFKVE